MTRICYLFISILLFAACTTSSEKNPCEGVVCDYMAPVCKFKLVEPGTGRDLVYGPYARIPLDSIKILMQDTIIQVKQVIDTPRNTAVLYFYVIGPQTLRVGRPAKTTLDKLNFLTRSVGCCGTEIYSLQLNDNPVPVPRDSANTYLIPYNL
ncbi:hypothetical protein [Chitinophaga ginsengisegetis]|uniref:hypothetical protein n=1 Tax=Chitinophaga ginsengisegetis TaxID=393003 RepID=UPI000DB9096F|nr:hypothetical protein [Chitinophaga ginsengisegetis]MDR6565860.1 hypothetical protein [Chitinophaga ginsengisegetis]MDR6645589.1 hypothetical protein [Chitinophaga ginsengisegetis]MDR6651819.1 hypothetical protein [Chitinophaga ginsengisegetis]